MKVEIETNQKQIRALGDLLFIWNLCLKHSKENSEDSINMDMLKVFSNCNNCIKEHQKKVHEAMPIWKNLNDAWDKKRG